MLSWKCSYGLSDTPSLIIYCCFLLLQFQWVPKTDQLILVNTFYFLQMQFTQLKDVWQDDRCIRRCKNARRPVLIGLALLSLREGEGGGGRGGCEVIFVLWLKLQSAWYTSTLAGAAQLWATVNSSCCSQKCRTVLYFTKRHDSDNAWPARPVL